MKPPTSVATRALCIALLAALPYLPSVANPYLWDDQRGVVQNPIATGSVPLGSVFGRDFFGHRQAHTLGLYRPIAILAIAAETRAFGLHPGLSHLINTVLHGACAVLLLLGLRRLGVDDTRATLAAALFASFAAHSEAVLQVVGRADLLATWLALFATLLHLRRRALPAAAALFLALLCKETALGAVAAWTVLDLAGLAVVGGALSIGQAVRRRGRAYVYYGVALALTLLLRRHALGSIAAWQGQVDFLKNPLAILGPWQHVLAWLKTYGLACRLFLLPTDLSMDYAYNAYGFPLSPRDPLVLLEAAVLIGGPVMAISARRRAPLLAGGIAWFLVSFFPVSNGLFVLPTVFGERFLYLPAAGLAVAGAAAFGTISRHLRRVAWLMILAFFLLYQSSLLFLRSLQWHGEGPLFAAALSGAAAGSAKVQYAAATERFDAGDLPRAMELSLRAAQILPIWPAPHDLIAVIHARRGDLALADQEFSRAEDLMGRDIDPDIRVDHAIFLSQTGRAGEAEDLLRRTLTEVPAVSGDPRLRDLLSRLPR